MSASLMAPSVPSSSFAARKFGQPQTPAHLLQFAGYVVSNEGIARWGSRLTNPPHTFPAGASLVAAHEVHNKLKELNLAGLLNVGTLENPRFIVFTKNKVLPYRANMHESELAPLQADKWDKWTLKVMIQELHVDPSEVTAFKSVLSNDMPHDPDVFGEMSRSEMEAWWREGPLN
ncbi:hypothetical protein P691DRAFT_780049 [Macrolepiota fuliginosa MF-IS2]|uniref:Uncharacterized protein n=1 Tax=Macrolepiota fuliginosa MF-IS2 TaxID=1400762 RepID=A0A9P5WY23_9AGAR|nr:hypothetical protein P691DRAFT_780049 [Macrolepiota fuliginosa MF-IS2]